MTSDFLVYQERETVLELAIQWPNCMWKFGKQTEVIQSIDNKTIVLIGRKSVKV